MKSATGEVIDGKRVAALVLFVAIGIFFWDSPFLLPVKLLVVAIHESGHLVATLLVGGRVQELVVSPNESGHCVSAAEVSFFKQVLVYSSGYVGSAIAGALLILLTFRVRLERAVVWAMTFWLLFVGAVYAGDAFTRLFCLGVGVILGVCAKVLPPGALSFLNLFLGAFTGLYALFDLRSDLWHLNPQGSDAWLLAQITWIPAIVWAALWSLAAMVVLGGALYLSLRGSARRRASPAL